MLILNSEPQIPAYSCVIISKDVKAGCSPLAFCFCSRIPLLVFDTSPPLPLPWLPIFHFSDTNTGSSSLMASLFWNYKLLPRTATCKRCKNRETFVDQMLSPLISIDVSLPSVQIVRAHCCFSFPAKGRLIEGGWRRRTKAEGGRASACAQTVKPLPAAHNQ